MSRPRHERTDPTSDAGPQMEDAGEAGESARPFVADAATRPEPPLPHGAKNTASSSEMDANGGSMELATTCASGPPSDAVT